VGLHAGIPGSGDLFARGPSVIERVGESRDSEVMGRQRGLPLLFEHTPDLLPRKGRRTPSGAGRYSMAARSGRPRRTSMVARERLSRPFLRRRAPG